MATQTLVPTTIEPRAAEFITQHKLDAPLAEMVEHIKLTVGGLRRVTVEYAPAFDSGNDGLLIIACSESPNRDDWDQFSAWKTACFSPDVWRHVNLILTSDDRHGG